MKIKNPLVPLFIFSLFLGIQCQKTNKINSQKTTNSIDSLGVSLAILGTIQDGGAPHIGCNKKCCQSLFLKPNTKLKVVSIGLIDYDFKNTWLIEATPNITQQLKLLRYYAPFKTSDLPDGIFLTHAHIGHYAGLMYLGKEAMASHLEPIYAMPRMKYFIESNGPWQQLVKQKNILIHPLKNEQNLQLSKKLTIVPFLVPHRDEYSETVGYKIKGPNKTALFIPDINKWSIWEKRIIEEIASVDYAFIDATFYDSLEINSRPISEIPHPFVCESLLLFQNLSKHEKDKVYFIHFNHTNPLINANSKQSLNVKNSGFHIAQLGDVFKL